MQNTEKRIRLRIDGMTCINCQSRIERTLRKTQGVLSVRVRYAQGDAEITYDERRITRERIEKIIEGLGYSVRTNDEARRLPKTACVLSIIVLLYVLLQETGLLNRLAPDRLAESGMGYGMLFVIGLITSVHCIAMCGGINLSQSLPVQGEKQKTRFPALAYNLGRVVSYTAIGLTLGVIGYVIGGSGQVGLSSLLQGVLKMAAGLLMIVMGVNMMGLFPALRRLTLRPPAWIAGRVQRHAGMPGRPFWIGVLNGFMPCGPLQSMWIVALASGSPLTGALSMLAFSLGTVPLMLGLGAAVSVLGKRFTNRVMQVGAVLVVVLGLAMLAQGGALSGWLPSELLLALLIAACISGVLLSIPVQRKACRAALCCACAVLLAISCLLGRTAAVPVTQAEESSRQDGVQIVYSTLSPGRYPSITVQAGTPVKWVIDAPEGSINGCNYRMMIPDYAIEHTFQTGENIIEFTPTQEGAVRFSCCMGMIRGTIQVAAKEAALLPAPSEAPVEISSYGGACCGL